MLKIDQYKQFYEEKANIYRNHIGAADRNKIVLGNYRLANDTALINIDKSISENLCHSVGMDENNDPTVIMPPIFYLFDHTIDDKNLSCKEEHLSYIRNYFKVDELFGIITENNMYVSVSAHATLLYKFSYKQRKYIYYSNSGLGAQNQLNSDKLTACKIFFIKNDIFYNQLQNYFEYFIQFLANYTTINYVKFKQNYIIKNKEKNLEFCTFLNTYDPITNSETNSDYEEIRKFKFAGGKDENIIYALLNYFCNKYNAHIEECTFNHVIFGNDEQIYLSYKSGYSAFTFLELLNHTKNCYNLELQTHSESKNNFELFIDEINDRLKQFAQIPSVKYKLDNTFSLVYNRHYGLFNNKQEAGSCTFYSYYNLGINMIILNNYDNRNVDNVIQSILTFHFYMMYLLCMNFDKSCFLNSKITQSNRLSYTFLQPIYSILINEKDIKDELITMFKKETFLLNFSNKLFIDNYYSDIKIMNINSTIIEQTPNNLIKIENFQHILDEFYSCINKYLYKIRLNNGIDMGSFRQEMRQSIQFDNLKLLPFYNKYNIIWPTAPEIYKVFPDESKKTKPPSHDGRPDSHSDDGRPDSHSDDGWPGSHSDDRWPDTDSDDVWPDSDNDIFSGGNKKIYYGGGQRINIIDKYYHTLCEIWIFYISLLKEYYDRGNTVDKIIDSNITTLLNFYMPSLEKDDNEYKPIESRNDLFKDNNQTGIDTDNCQVLPFIYLSLDEVCMISTYLDQNRTNFDDTLVRFEILYKSFITYLSFEHQFIDDKDKKNPIDFELFNVYISQKDKKNMYIQYLNQNRFTHDNKIIFLKYLNYDVVNYFKYLRCLIKIDEEPFDYDVNLYITLFYIQLTHMINVRDLSQDIKSEYLSKKKYIKKLVENLSVQHLTCFELYILLDEKILIIFDTNIYTVRRTDTMLFQYINKEAEVYVLNQPLTSTELIEIKKIYNMNINIDSKINKIKLFLGNSHEKLGLLIKYNIVDNLDKYIAIKNQKIEFNLSETEIRSYSAKLDLLLYSFGIDINDTYNYTIVIDKDIIQNEIRERYSKIMTHDQTSIFVIIRSENKVLELNFNQGVLDKNKCYLHINKDIKHELILDLDKKNHPFIMFFPENAPFLCYKHNNKYNLLYFVNYNKDMERLIDLSDEILKKYKNIYQTKIFHFTISPSEIFPSISSFNIDIYKDLYSLNQINQLNYINDQLTNQFNFTDIIEYNDFIVGISELVCDIIKCNMRSEDMETFSDIIGLYVSKKNSCLNISNTIKSILNRFISENRLIEFEIHQTHKMNLQKKLDLCIKYKNSLYQSIDISNIIGNLSTHIYIMEFNMIINFINQILTVELTSGEIQGMLNSLNNIVYFNSKSFQYYNFEILYLLQNEYFFNQSQLQKYDSIRIEMQNNVHILKLHQFMMGKGKTSVFTPLLSFFASIFLNKKATIITLPHLVQPTYKYISFLKHIAKIDNIELYSDFEAKNRWLKCSDKSLQPKTNDEKINENEINIIDEIDTQHNYLNSMFNLIPSHSSIKIPENYIKYTFDYAINDGLSKIEEDDTLTQYFKEQIKQLYTHSEVMQQNKKMEFNRTYGFEFLYQNDYEKYRLCTPFIRKDTPQIGSKFSNTFLSIILTINAYKILSNEKFLLLDQLYDFDNLLENIDILNKITNIIDNHYESDKSHSINMYLKIKKNQEPLNSIKQYFNWFYQKNNIVLNKIILIEYLCMVNDNNIKYSNSQYNVSFQDIIYNNYNQWQVGYTGTASLELNNYFDNDGFLMKCIDEDPDEFIEIQLAFKKFYNIPHQNEILILEDNNEINNQILAIKNYLSENDQNPRGIVDLAGLFIYYDNKFVAKKFKERLPEKEIVYFNKDNNGTEFNENDFIEIPYKEAYKQNFYYYDNRNTVGSDLKQPYDGHIAVIINQYTKYTDFAQALFRFRKINRGTYMSIIYIKNSSDHIEPSKLTYGGILKLLQHNEILFNQNQNMGIRYQLLKTIIRKHTKNYIEKDLINITMQELAQNTILDYLNKSILGIENIDKFCQDYHIDGDYKDYINKLYLSLTSNPSLLHSLIFDTNQKQISVDMNAEVIAQVNAETTASVSEESTLQLQQIQQINNLIFSKNIYISIYKIENKSVITHANCEKCIQFNCTPLFSDINYMKILNKPIYISYNLLADYRSDITYFCFVEFSNMILIENEKVGIDYYMNRLPVYNCTGELILFNPNYTQILIIDKAIIDLFDINNYLFINREISLTTKIDITKLTENSILILGYHYIVYNALYSQDDDNADYISHTYQYIIKYNFSIELLKKISEINFRKLERITIANNHDTRTIIRDNTINPYNNDVIKSKLPICYLAYNYIFPIDNRLEGAGYNTKYRKRNRISKKKITKKNRISNKK
jgi:hypothetical protein